METVHIVAAKRSPIGKFGGGLKDVSPTELATHVAAATLPEGLRAQVDEVILGQVLQAGSGMNVARQVALRLGLPHAVPAFTVNMACGSSLKAVALATASLAHRDASLVLAGGVENMSAAPYLMPNLRWGRKLGDASAVDSLQHDGLSDPVLQIGMGETAERIVDLLGISRADQDAYAAHSHAKALRDPLAFTRETVSVSHGKKLLERDEHPRADSTPESLAKLSPVFRKDGTVTAGNASGINDGAAWLLLARGDVLASCNLESRARVVAWSATGCDPATMGLGPVGAIRALLAKTGWDPASVDAYEINEAFAAQALGCIRQLELPIEKVNLRGGGIALGHPIGASGARVLVTLLHVLEDHGMRRGIASLCIGGGMGIALAIER